MREEFLLRSGAEWRQCRRRGKEHFVIIPIWENGKPSTYWMPTPGRAVAIRLCELANRDNRLVPIGNARPAEFA
jgi:hypothetical protein